MATIDADGHIVEKAADLLRHLPEPYSRRTGALLPSDGMDTNMGGLLGGLEGNDVPTRLKDMDTEGIDVSVLFPTSSFGVNSLVERDYAVAYARAYNDFIAASASRAPGSRRSLWFRYKTPRLPSRKRTGRSRNLAYLRSPSPPKA